MQLESIALSRDVPAIFAWFVNPLIRRVSRQTLAKLLEATRRGLLSAGTVASNDFPRQPPLLTARKPQPLLEADDDDDEDDEEDKQNMGTEFRP